MTLYHSHQWTKAPSQKSTGAWYHSCLTHGCTAVLWVPAPRTFELRLTEAQLVETRWALMENAAQCRDYARQARDAGRADRAAYWTEAANQQDATARVIDALTTERTTTE